MSFLFFKKKRNSNYYTELIKEKCKYILTGKRKKEKRKTFA